MLTAKSLRTVDYYDTMQFFHSIIGPQFEYIQSSYNYEPLSGPAAPAYFA